MPVVAWIVCGAFIGVVLAGMSLRLARWVSGNAQDTSHLQTAVFCALSMLIGGATARVVADTTSISAALILVLVSVLAMVQAPLDLLTRRLSRPVTLTTLIGIVVVLLVGSTIDRRFDEVPPVFAVATVVTCVYALVHRTMPTALGWGDVLLVAPLTLAVGAASLENVVMWQLLASVSAAVHGGTSRWIYARTLVAFGPHLLLSAWLVLALSL